MAFILTKPVGNTGSSSGIFRDDGIIVPPSTTQTVDVVDTSLLSEGVKWIVTIMDNVIGSKNISEVLAIESSSGIKYNRIGFLGDLISHQLNVNLSGSNIELDITNNSISNNIEVNIVRI